MAWILRNGEDANRLAPRSFFIPPREHRCGLYPGKLVKLGFDCDDRVVDGQRYDGERMWVEVLEANADATYRGRLVSEPRIVTEVELGEVVEFGQQHVLAIAYDDGELGYDHRAWAYVDARLRGEDRPADYFTFQPSSPEGERIWWGGVGAERPDDTMTLGDLTDRWPQLAEVFRSDGGWWEWNASEGRYVQTRTADGSPTGR